MRKIPLMETIDGKNTMEESFVLENEEVEIYKERLKEVEEAFRYNLKLLFDRDAELDALEEQLRNRIVDLEKISQQKAECEEFLKRVDEERMNEIKMLKSELLSKEKVIRDLERKNHGNLKTLKKTVEDLKQEQTMENKKLAAKFETEKSKIEKNMNSLIHVRDAKHQEELNHLNRKYINQLDEIRKERRELDSFRIENRKLKKKLLELQRESEEKERYYLLQIKQLNNLYSRVSDELEDMLGNRDNVQVENRGIMAQPTTSEASTQTVNDGVKVDGKEFRKMQQQNDVLKCIVKELKRNRANVTGGKGESKICDECLNVKNKFEETNKKFENEINELKKIFEGERSQRLEEEAVIQNLETSVSCLKEKMLADLHHNLDELNGEKQFELVGPIRNAKEVDQNDKDYESRTRLRDGGVCAYVIDEELQNQPVSLIESLLNKKMESIRTNIVCETETVRRKLEEFKAEFQEKLGLLLERGKSMGTEAKGMKKIHRQMRQQVDNSENDLTNVHGSIRDSRKLVAVDRRNDWRGSDDSNSSVLKRNFNRSCTSHRNEDTMAKSSIGNDIPMIRATKISLKPKRER